MKKILVLMAMIATIWSVKGQTFYAGGAVGVSCVKDNNQFAFLPQAGYEFNDKLAVGAGIGYEYLYEESFVEVNPYVRYTPWHNENLFLDLKGQVILEFVDGYSLTQVGVTPSFRYRLTDKWEVAADLGILGMQFSDGESSPVFSLKNSSVNASVLYRF